MKGGQSKAMAWRAPEVQFRFLVIDMSPSRQNHSKSRYNETKQHSSLSGSPILSHLIGSVFSNRS